MALTFGAVTSDRVDCGSAAGIDNLSPRTALLWVNITTLTNVRRFLQKGRSGDNTRGIVFFLSGTVGNLAVLADRATTDATYITNDAPLVTTSVWKCVAAVLDVAAGAGEIVQILTGSLTTALVESAYGTATDGSGALNDDSAYNLVVGNDAEAAPATALQGAIAFAAYFTGAIATATLEVYRQFPYLVKINAGIRARWSFLGTGTQYDSVGGNNGTVTGATASTPIPKITSIAQLVACGC